MTTFVSAWPCLDPGWELIPEYPVGADLVGGRVRVAGRVDLALGANQVELGNVIRRERVLIELRSGQPTTDHRAEHLLYALLETLGTGVAPWRAATFWLDQGTFLVDTITLELLTVAARRLVHAARRLIELGNGRPPTRQAGWRCSWCPLAEHCEERLRANHDRRLSCGQ